jgi:hypothetical protein
MTAARKAGLQFLAAMIAAAMLIVISPGQALAVDDLELTGDTTFRVNLDESRVDVATTYSVRNVKPNTRRGNTITKYYYDRVFFGVPRDADNIAVTSNDREVDFVDDFEEGARYLDIEFPSRLWYRQTRTLEITYSLDGSRLAQLDPVRVNPAHLTMWAWAWGDPGRASVRIEVPHGYQLDWGGTDGSVEGLLRDFSDRDLDVWYSEDIADPDAWWVSLTGDRPSALAVDELDVDGIAINVKSWPGDSDWYDTVTAAIEEGLPALVDAVGLDWPVDDALIISQSSIPNRVGYGGWYFTELDEIEIGEDVDEFLVLHEVSHAWFNDALFVERWIGEGLADAIPAYVLRNALDITEFPSVVSRTAAAGVRLNEWADPQFDLEAEEAARELWAYNASYWTVHQLIDEIGMDGLTAVLVAAADDEIAYRGVVR